MLDIVSMFFLCLLIPTPMCNPQVLIRKAFYLRVTKHFLCSVAYGFMNTRVEIGKSNEKLRGNTTSKGRNVSHDSVLIQFPRLG